MATSDECALSPTLMTENADSFIKRLKKAKPKLLKPSCTNVRLETVHPAQDHDSRLGLSDVVTDDQELGGVLQVRVLLILSCPRPTANGSTETPATSRRDIHVRTRRSHPPTRVLQCADGCWVSSYLFQDHTWAPFNLSEEALRQIVTAIQPRQDFLRLFTGFGPPDEGYEADFSGGYTCHVAEGSSSSSSKHDNEASGCEARRWSPPLPQHTFLQE
jgi:hypothetical protein